MGHPGRESGSAPSRDVDPEISSESEQTVSAYVGLDEAAERLGRPPTCG